MTDLASDPDSGRPEPTSGGSESSELPAPDRVLGAVAALVTLVAAVSAWRGLSGDVAKGFALGGIAILLFMFRRVYPLLKGRKLNRQLVLNLGAAGLLGVCAAVVFANLASSALPTLRFVEANAENVCQAYYGTGTIPKGYDLLVFDHPPHGSYYLDGLAVNQRHGGWKSPKLQAGNNPTIISAVLVSAATGTSLHQIFLYSNDLTVEAKVAKGQLGLSWLSHSLPRSEERIPALTVHPPNGDSGCSR